MEHRGEPRVTGVTEQPAQQGVGVTSDTNLNSGMDAESVEKLGEKLMEDIRKVSLRKDVDIQVRISAIRRCLGQFRSDISDLDVLLGNQELPEDSSK